MLSLIVVMLFALAVAYFAIQNTIGVTLVVANNVIANVPLYFVIISSIVLGVLLSSIISGMNSLEAYQKLRGKEKVIAHDQEEIHALQDKVQSLETENAQLLAQREQHVENAHEVEPKEAKPSFFQTFFNARRESHV